jgi:outer membrane protein assembly factor BamB
LTCNVFRATARRHLLCIVALVLAGSLAALAPPSTAQQQMTREGGDWLRFGYDPARGDAGPAETGITADNVGRIVLTRISLAGSVDSSPIYLRDALIRGQRHDVFIATTAYGRVAAVNADSLRLLWEFTPPGYSGWAGTGRITTSSPAVDRSRQYVYSAAPNGFIYKLRIATGAAVRSRGWPVLITKSPAFEKISSPLNINGNLLLATTSSFGDVGDYQGHVLVIDSRSGRVLRVWNALCGRTRRLLAPPSCGWSGAGIWARAGVVVQPGTGNLLFATGNGVWDGLSAWSNSVIVLSPDGRRRIGSWTPLDWMALSTEDLDIGSTAPALLSNWVAVQGGKDGKLRLLDLRFIERKRPRGILGHALQVMPGPGGAVFSAPAVWKSGGRTWLFVSTSSHVAGYTFSGHKLALRWNQPVQGPTLGTSPVVAGGLLYLNNVANRSLDVYRPTTGKLITSLPAGDGHWNTPIVTDGRIALGEGDANSEPASGGLDVYSFGRADN